MSLYVPTLTQHELIELAADVRQLTEPWHRVAVREWHTWDRNRNKVPHTQRVRLREPPLLDQLRGVAVGQLPQHLGARPAKRGRLDGKPPPGWSEAASARLADLYIGLDGWAVRLSVAIFRSDGDRPKARLRALVGRAPGLDVDTGRALAADVRGWWLGAVKQSGLDPDELLAQRRGS